MGKKEDVNVSAERPRLSFVVLFHESFMLELRQEGSGNVTFMPFVTMVDSQTSANLRVLQPFGPGIAEQ